VGEVAAEEDTEAVVVAPGKATPHFSGLNFGGLADIVEPHRFSRQLIQAGVLLIESFFIL